MIETIRANHLMHPLRGLCQVNTSAQAACKIMSGECISAALVEDAQKELVGIISSSDITKLIAEDKSLADTPVQSFMSTPIHAVDINDDIETILIILNQRQCRRLLVTDKNNPVGIISRSDILRNYMLWVKEYAETLEISVKERTQALQEVSETKDELLGTAAHDIRNPLGVILAWTEILEGSLGDSIDLETAEGLETINRQAMHILNIVNDVLDVSKIEAGKVNLDMQAFDPAEFIVSSFKSNELLASRKDIKLINNAPLNMPLIYGDKGRLNSVMDNLISNGIKYTNSGGEISINVEVGASSIDIAITDNGLGIPKDEQSNLFKAFSTTSTRPTAGEKSTGLGLVIVKKIVTLHQGTIAMESVEGEGSTFTITLPLLHGSDIEKGTS